MRFIRVSIFCFGILGASFALASGGGGGGEAKKNADPGVPESEKEFMDKTMKMNLAASRIMEAEGIFKELVKKKKKAKTPAEKEAILKEMVEQNKIRNKEVDSFNKTRADIELRYPMQGKQLNRMYKTQQKRSVEEMENKTDIDEMLTQVHRQVRKKFEPFETEEDKQQRIVPVESVKPEKEKRLRLEK